MNAMNTILEEIQSVIDRVDEESVDRFARALIGGQRIFVVGEGRSGFMAKSFAMRLMHLGAVVYVVGETITPALAKGDAMVAVSGSGRTAAVLTASAKARELGGTVAAVTTDDASSLAQLADIVLHVPAATKYRREGERRSVQPLGSLFDQCAHLLLDAVCLRYAALTGADHASAFGKHSNLEQ
ncbi:6-phospho-3-hexuloisomerase [Paenibacillus sp.]|uniref:6-phospho-3-hexuloisomerase n=1 Tax=Paenibacillus sp. TaxID=58172 RepID=UPI002D2928D0|nr:6-phospho-3-hexuloisomerase [Paenibacillus sp.]HZG87957.1 6-phospho-3-hexuloisomerase [Paenibacillus sp.]